MFPKSSAEVLAGEEPFLERKVTCINATVLFCCTLTRLREVEHCFGFETLEKGIIIYCHLELRNLVF